MLKDYGKQSGGKVVDPESVDPTIRAALTSALDETFGTPAAPKLPGAEFTHEEQLAAGSKLYRSQCVHCHGLTGNGRGQTGLFLEPPPRDFRSGGFKSSLGTTYPSAAVMKRVLREGVKGTQMQAYDLLSDSEIDAIVAYVVHLSVRGTCEIKALVAAEAEESADHELLDLIRTDANALLNAWRTTWTLPLPAVEFPKDTEAIRRGYALTTVVGCTTCHGGNLRGGAFRYDVWGNSLRVPDLTMAEWKWGREPGDLHARMRYGIAPSNMPANPLLSERQTRDLAAFLGVIGRPDLLPDDLRKEVHKP